MAKFDIYGPFAGVKDGLTLLALMGEKKKRKEFRSILEHLESEREKLNQAIEVYGKARQIDGLLSAAKEKAGEASRKLQEAGAKAHSIELAAKAASNRQHGVFGDRELSLLDREKKLADAEQRWKAGVETSEHEMAAREKAVTKREEKAERDLAEAKDLKKRYESALDTLKAGVAAA